HHAVRAHAAAVGPHQHRRDERRVLGAHAGGGEDVGDPALEPLGAHHFSGKFFFSQSRSRLNARASFSPQRKGSTPATRCSSVGWPAWRNSSIDCSVGVTVSFDGWMRSSGRGAILPTTSFALKVYMLSTTSKGNSSTEPGARPLRSSGRIGTMS